jgi:nitrous oxidase accessory protein
MIRKWLTLIMSSIILLNCFAFNSFIMAETTYKGAIIYVNASNTAGPWDGTLEHPYQHIQDGVNNATNGDTVFVFSGIYHEKIIVNKAIQLIGENENTTIINQSGQTYDWIIRLNSDTIHFNHFTILTQGLVTAIGLASTTDCNISACTIHSYWAIELNSSNDNYIVNNRIFTISGGINLYYGSENNIIQNNYLTNTGNSSYTYKFGVCFILGATHNYIISNYFDDCEQYAVIGIEVQYNIVKNNIILQNRNRDQYGIRFTWVQTPPNNGNTIQQNIIRNCSECGIAANTNGNIVIGNLIDHCGYGMSISANYITITNNTIHHCNVGQDIRFASYLTPFHGNIYDHCTEGIEIWGCNFVRFTRNTFSNNTYGITSYDFSNFNLFYRNNFMNNKNDVYQEFSRNFWLHNYWGQPRHLPKPIFGIFPFVQFDWLPAQNPN